MTLEFACHRVGVTDCRAVTTAETRDELLSKVAEHAERDHGVTLNDTLISYALTTVRET